MRSMIGRAVRVGAGAVRRGAMTAARDLSKEPTCRTLATAIGCVSLFCTRHSSNIISVDLAADDVSRDLHFGFARSSGALASLHVPARASAHALKDRGRGPSPVAPHH